MSRASFGNRAYVTPVRPRSKITRPCPKCGAQPFFSCRKLHTGKYNQQKDGEDGAYWVNIKSLHRER